MSLDDLEHGWQTNSHNDSDTSSAEKYASDYWTSWLKTSWGKEFEDIMQPRLDAKTEIVKAAKAWCSRFDDKPYKPVTKQGVALLAAVKAYTDLTEESPVPRFTDGKTESRETALGQSVSPEDLNATRFCPTAATTSPVSTPEGLQGSSRTSPSGNFAVGDKVKVVSSPLGDLQDYVGHTGTIVSISNYCRVDFNDGNAWLYSPSELEKVPEPLKVGDRVKVNDKYPYPKFYKGVGVVRGRRDGYWKVDFIEASGIFIAKELTKITEETEVTTGYITTVENNHDGYPVTADYFAAKEEAVAVLSEEKGDNKKVWKYTDGTITEEPQPVATYQTRNRWWDHQTSPFTPWAAMDLSGVYEQRRKMRNTLQVIKDVDGEVTVLTKEEIAAL